MTEAQFQKRMKELIKENSRSIEKRIAKALSSGCFDLSDHEDNFLLPKAVMTAVCKEMTSQWEPFSADYKILAKNIYRHI